MTVTGKLTVRKGEVIEDSVYVIGGGVITSKDVIAGLFSLPVSLRIHYHMSPLPEPTFADINSTNTSSYFHGSKKHHLALTRKAVVVIYL